MIERYKVVLSNKNFYKEIEISNDMQTVSIGTNLECAVRLRRDFFFENLTGGSSGNTFEAEELISKKRRMLKDKKSSYNFLRIE